MSAARPLPHPLETTRDALARIEAGARREEVRGEDATVVWRSWGSGAPVVLLHGGSGSWNHWVRNIASLVDAGRQVWVPDLPGFGESSLPAVGGDADALPAPVEATMRTLLGDAKVDLVGFSFGGMVAAFIAAQHPARVRRLVLVGAPALGIHGGRRIVLRSWRHLEDEEARLAAHRSNLAALMLRHPESIDELALEVQSTNLPRDRMQSRRLSRTEVLLRTLPSVRCPVYGIWGAEDALYQGSQQRLAPALAHAPEFRWLQLIPDAGHWVQFEAAEAFDRTLASALQADD